VMGMRLREDFETKSSYWRWRVDGFAGFEIENSVLRMWMGPTEALYYSNAEIADGEFDECPWIEARVAVKARLLGNHFGSAGWGLWNHSMVLGLSMPIWFIYLRARSPRYPLQGFFAQIGTSFYPIKAFKSLALYALATKIVGPRGGAVIERSKPCMQGLDLSQWHEYVIELRSGLARLYIDGVLVAEKRVSASTRFRVDVWIDNAVYVPSKSYDAVYRHVTQENRSRAYLEIDWIEVEGKRVGEQS